MAEVDRANAADAAAVRLFSIHAETETAKLDRRLPQRSCEWIKPHPSVARTEHRAKTCRAKSCAHSRGIAEAAAGELIRPNKQTPQPCDWSICFASETEGVIQNETVTPTLMIG